MYTLSGMKCKLTTSRSVSTRAAAPAVEYDMKKSGLKHLPEKARELATQKKANNFEKVKNEKCGSRMWTEVHELSAKLKEGTYTFEDLDLDDVNIRLKWAGLFHRAKRTPGKFMMRLKVCYRSLRLAGRRNLLREQFGRARRRPPGACAFTRR